MFGGRDLSHPYETVAIIRRDDIHVVRQKLQIQIISHDGLGSVRSQVDATGAVVADQWYDPYGQVIDDNGTWVGSFGYAGEQTDESGLGYNRARYYNPSMGAFASLDPFEGYEERPMSLNGYGYVEGNPTNWTDPSGEILPFIATALGGAAIGGFISGFIGYAQGSALWHATMAGQCGCQAQQQVQEMGFSGFVTQFSKAGFLMGALLGAGVASGGVLGTLASQIAIASSLVDFLQAASPFINDFLDDFQMNSTDTCDWLNLAFAAADIVGEGATIELVSNSKGGRSGQRRKPKNPNSHNPPINRPPVNTPPNSPNRGRTARRPGAEQDVSIGSENRRKWYGDDDGNGKPNPGNQIGKDRQQRLVDYFGDDVVDVEVDIIAEGVGGTDIDILLTGKRYIEVGGPAKINKLDQFVTKLHKLRTYAKQTNGTAYFYYDAGTSQVVINKAKKMLGDSNVIKMPV